MSRWDYPPGASAAERARIDEDAADHGIDERDGFHDEH